MYTFYSSHILSICLFRVVNMQSGTLHAGQRIGPAVCSVVDAQRCGALKIGEARQKPATGPLSVLRGKSHRSYLPDEQGHCDTVFEYKDIF